MAPDLAVTSLDDAAAERILSRVERETVRHIAAHRDELRAAGVTEAANLLRERAETVRDDPADPLVAALLGFCNTLGGNVVADPEVIARVAYRALADLIDRSAADLSGHSRTVPNDTPTPRTEATS